MRKLFLFIATALVSTGMWAGTETLTLSKTSSDWTVNESINATVGTVSISSSNNAKKYSKKWGGESNTDTLCIQVSSNSFYISSTSANISKIEFIGWANSSSASNACDVQSSATSGGTYSVVSSNFTATRDGSALASLSNINMAGYDAVGTDVVVSFSTPLQYLMIKKNGKETWLGTIKVWTYTPDNYAPSFTAPATEPASVYYETNQDADELSVTVDGYPNPGLQWYYKTSKEAADSTTLTGETSATYTPSTTSEGDFYYYCKATNTEGDALSKFFHINVTEAVCPSGITISGENEYSECTDIELTASLTEGNGEITYNWYKGDDLAAAIEAGSIGTGTTYSKASCAKSDAGNYFCVATKANCSEAAASEAFEVTITDYVCPTSGVLFALTMKDNLDNISLNANTEMEITTEYATILNGSAILRNNDGNDGKAKINESHIYFNGGKAYVKVEMTCGPLASGDTIAFTSTNFENELWLTNTNSNSEHIETSGRKHVVVKDDLLDGKSVFYVWRKSGATYVKTMKVIRPAGSATGIENQESKIDNRKFIKDGQLFIEKNGHVYNVFGTCIK